MARKKPNFFQNLWNKGKNIIKGVVTVGGNALGSLIGVPVLGSVAAGVLDKIPTTTQDKMVEAAKRDGVTKPDKVAETIVKHTGEQPTQAVVAQIANKIALQSKTVTTASAYTTTDPLTGHAKPNFDLMTFIKTKWYFLVAGLVGVYFLFFNKPKGGRRF